VLGSVVVIAHLLGVAVTNLFYPSGPWPTPFGGNMATPPQFAEVANRVTHPVYADALRVTHSPQAAMPSRPGIPGVYFEARLRDEAGNEIRTVRFPDPDANPWVRHRQSLLARGLADDLPVQTQQGESIAAPNQKVQTVGIWDMPEGQQRGLVIRQVPEHLVPRDRPVFRPGDWSLLLARSYARHLCRAHGAASCEIVRHSQEPIPPMVLFVGDNIQAGAFDELISNFGEMKK
jgi:hypothetical protein